MYVDDGDDIDENIVDSDYGDDGDDIDENIVDFDYGDDKLPVRRTCR